MPTALFIQRIICSRQFVCIFCSKMESLPIDIHSNKLLDWLISRRHCKKDWQEQALKIREKVRCALLDMPENEQIVAIFKQGPCITYFHVKEIVDVLKTTEGSRNIFGSYSSQRIKDWQDIMYAYEKDSVYLAESASLLQRFVQYEIPSLRKQISRSNAAIDECIKSERDYARQSVDAQRNFSLESTNKWRIRGENIRQELLAKTSELPVFFADILSRLKPLASCLQHYYAYSESIELTIFGVAHGRRLELLDLLCSGRDVSDLTIFELKHKQKPSQVERLQLLQQNSTDEAAVEEIDFGFDDDPTADFATTYKEGEFNIEIEAFDGGDEGNKESIMHPSANLVESERPTIATGHEALFPLEHLDTLYLCLEEIKEIIAFLKFRKNDEMNDDMSSMYFTEINCPPVKRMEFSLLDASLSQFMDIFSLLSSPHTVQLIKIQSEKTYIDEIVAGLETKKGLSNKYSQMATLMGKKIEESNAAHNLLLDDVNKLVEAAKELQLKIEADLSKRYNNREVYIMGEINAVLYDS